MTNVALRRSELSASDASFTKGQATAMTMGTRTSGRKVFSARAWRHVSPWSPLKGHGRTGFDLSFSHSYKGSGVIPKVFLDFATDSISLLCRYINLATRQQRVNEIGHGTTGKSLFQTVSILWSNLGRKISDKSI